MIYFHLFTCGCPVLPAPFVEETVFLTLCRLASFVIDYLTIGTWTYFQVFYPVPLIYISIFVPVPYCFDDCNFVVQPEVKEPDSSSSIFQDLLWLFGVFYVSIQILRFFLFSMKNAIGHLIGIALNLQIALGSIVIQTILILPIHEHGISFHLFMSSSDKCLFSYSANFLIEVFFFFF